MKQINDNAQRFVVYKINPNEQEINGEVNFNRNADGRILYGNAYIINDCLIVKDEDDQVLGIFSLNHYYFLS